MFNTFDSLYLVFVSSKHSPFYNLWNYIVSVCTKPNFTEFLLNYIGLKNSCKTILQPLCFQDIYNILRLISVLEGKCTFLYVWTKESGPAATALKPKWFLSIYYYINSNTTQVWCLIRPAIVNMGLFSSVMSLPKGIV